MAFGATAMPFLGLRLRALGRGTLPRGAGGHQARPYKLVNKNRSGSSGNAAVGSVWYQKHVELMSSCSGW